MSSIAAQQYFLLCKAARGSVAAELVIKILEHEDIYGFNEFLRLDSFVNALKDDFSQHLSTLNLFAYGKLSDYENERSKFLVLSSSARRKLQLLTLATMAAHARVLPYEILQKELQIESIRELEDLIIDGIYAQMIQGKLDRLNSRLTVEFAIARDVDAVALDRIEDVLDKWCFNCTALLNVLKHEAHSANQRKKTMLNDRDKYEKEKLSMIKAIELQGQQNAGSRRNNNENNNSLVELQSLSNVLTGNVDSNHSGTKKMIRNPAKRTLHS